MLSELLQNADDANATEARVRILDGVFTFSHNGDDFNEEQFSSLCRFGSPIEVPAHNRISWDWIQKCL